MIRPSFKTKFIIILLLVAVIPTVFIGTMTYSISKARLYEKIYECLQTDAAHYIDNIDRFLYERYNDLEILVNDTLLSDKNVSAEIKTLQLKDYLLNLGIYNNFYIADLEGNIIANTNRIDGFPNIKDTEWFKNTEKVFWNATDVEISPFSNKPTVIFSQLIVDENKKRTGIIIAELLWPVAVEILEDADPETEVVLINNDNMQIGSNTESSILEKNWSFFVENNFQDKNFFTATATSKGYLVYKGNKWKIFVRVPVDIAFEALNQLFFVILITLIITVIIIIITGLLIGQRFVKPIIKLTKGAQRIQRGNLDQKIQVKTKDELGFLANAFNDMCISLKNKRDELQSALKRERDLDKTKDEFWLTASHKLRTPITGMKWSLEMLDSKITGNLTEKQKEIVENVSNNLTRLNFLVNILLNTARLEEGEIKLQKEHFYLEDILSSALKEQELMRRNRKIKLIKPALKEREITLFTDPRQLKQVFEVLLNNAIIYNNENGEIRIYIKRTKSKVVCSISDTGIGIHEFDKKGIFKKFFRGKNAPAKNTEGLGLGLYLSKIIIESSGGKISFNSKLNTGTEFVVELPVK